MKKLILFIFTFLFNFCLNAQSPSRIAYSKIISLPLDRAVYQRNSSNSATIKLATQFGYGSNIQTGTAKYYVEQLDKNGDNPSPGTYYIAPTTISDASLIQNNGLFNTDLSLATGWYKITVTARFFFSPCWYVI